MSRISRLANCPVGEKRSLRYNASMRIFVVAVFFLLTLALVWRIKPVMEPRETYNTFFPREKFLKKMGSPVSKWMTEQLEGDFHSTFPITAEKVAKAYHTIIQRIQDPSLCSHYRVIDNQLYKYTFQKHHAASRDTGLEKAFKTLLCQVKVPDIDFIVVPMDGIPETHLAPDFYLMQNPLEQVPILGQAKLREPLTQFVVLIPDQISLSESWYNISKEVESINDLIPWKEKKGKAFWRGGTADIPIPEKDNGTLSITPRVTLCRLSQKNPEWVDARFYTADSPTLFKLLEKEGLLSPFIEKRDHLRYRYQPAINGHMCTYPGLHWRLYSDALTLKQESDQIQWFYSALKPYEHYLPIANDLSDLIEKMEWAQNHEKECLKMVENARAFVSSDLLYEDCYRYLFLVFAKYAEHQEIDFKSLRSQMQKDPHWVNIQCRKRAEFLKWVHSKLEKAS